MASKRSLSRSPSSEPNDDNPASETQTENSTKPNLCLICGDQARFTNYGALSCQSCKTFFRRNGYHPETVRPCIYDQTCDITIYSRHTCTACRLAKCFRMGMTSDLIRKEHHKKGKTSSTTPKSENIEQVSSEQPTTVSSLTATTDLVQDISSLLSNADWTLLSNILYAYDIFSIIPQICETIDNLPKSSMNTNLDSINPIEIVGQIFTSIQSLIRAIPDFRILTIDEQTSLFERNLHGVVGFYFVLFSRQTNIFQNIQYTEAFTAIYGSETILSVKDANDQLDPDVTVVKLILIVLTFSSQCFIVDNSENIGDDRLLYGTFRLLGSQNVYLELLWKYMIHRYGYSQSITRLSRLIKICLCVLRTSATIYMTNPAHQTMVDTIIEKIKQSLTMNVNEQTPLWGKS